VLVVDDGPFGLVLVLGLVGRDDPPHAGARVRAGAARAGAGLLALHRHLLALALPLPLAGPDHLQEGVEVLDDHLLLLAGLFAGVGLAEALLDLAHLLDGTGKWAVVLALLLPLLLLDPEKLLQAVIGFLVVPLRADGLSLLGGLLPAGRGL